MHTELKTRGFVTYEDFGAVGDGIADDMAAIVTCHEYANAHTLPVRAKDGATYYIGGKDMTAFIMTDTDFGKAKFIIDDRNVENIKTSVFIVKAEEEYYTPNIQSLRKEQTKVDFPHTGNVYVRIYSDVKKAYIRKGRNKNEGSDLSDCFLVDGEGNILNQINWDYPTVSQVYAKSADDTPITIQGGEFITIANAAPSFYTYYARNIRIFRSNVTLKNLTHRITGEGDHGAPYNGFISVFECSNTTVKDLLLTPHFTYWTASKIPGEDVPMGSYGLSFSAAIGVKLIGLRQTIDIMDRRYWGLMGSNFSKDVTVEGCVVSRFDAHCGVTNGVIKNCTFGHVGVNLIGFGNFLLENTTVKGRALINFRPDYGSFFDGVITIRNCVWEPLLETNTCIFTAHNTGDHNFGYECPMATEIYIDGLTIRDNKAEKDIPFYVFPDYDPEFEAGKPYAYIPPAKVSLKHIQFTTERSLELWNNPLEYSTTKVVQE